MFLNFIDLRSLEPVIWVGKLGRSCESGITIYFLWNFFLSCCIEYSEEFSIVFVFLTGQQLEELYSYCFKTVPPIVQARGLLSQIGVTLIVLQPSHGALPYLVIITYDIPTQAAQ